MSRESYRLHLESLTDRELCAESRRAIDLDLDRSVEERDRRVNDLPSTACWFECVRRRMPELWRDALASVKAERAAQYAKRGTT